MRTTIIALCILSALGAPALAGSNTTSPEKQWRPAGLNDQIRETFSSLQGSVQGILPGVNFVTKDGDLGFQYRWKRFNADAVACQGCNKPHIDGMRLPGEDGGVRLHAPPAIMVRIGAKW